MRIAVAGGTGQVGRYVVSAITDAGATPTVLARSMGVDLATGKGLSGALAGVDAVIDVTNVSTIRRSTATTFFTTVARTLQEGAAAAGVRHVVTLSIVGIDRVPGYGYYAGKLAQEQVALAGPVQATVLRSTQFHEFAEQILARTLRGPVAVVPKMRVQPVAAQSVAEVLVSLARGHAGGLGQEVAGPDVHELPALARAVLRHRGRAATVLAPPAFGATGRAMAGGALLPGPTAEVLGPSFGSWLAGSTGHGRLQ